MESESEKVTPATSALQTIVVLQHEMTIIVLQVFLNSKSELFYYHENYGTMYVVSIANSSIKDKLNMRNVSSVALKKWRHRHINFFRKLQKISYWFSKHQMDGIHCASFLKFLFLINHFHIKTKEAKVLMKWKTILWSFVTQEKY